MELNPVCVDCLVEMTCVKTGALLVVRDPDGDPLRVVSGDEFTCKKCGTSVLAGFGCEPITDTSRPDLLAFFVEEAQKQDKVRRERSRKFRKAA